jgi:hypothetical protein
MDKDTSPTELGGSVVVQNEKGKTMKTDLSNGQLYLDDDDEDSDDDDGEDPKEPSWGNVPHQQDHKTYECGLCKASFKSRNLLFKHLKDVNYHQVAIPNTKKRGAPDVTWVKSSKKWLNCSVYIGAEEYNKVEAFAVQAKCITSNTNHRFAKICKLHKLEASLHGKYRNWLLSEVTLDDGRPISPEDIPLARGMAVRPGMKFPYPSGTKWRMFSGIKNKYLNPTNADRNEHELLEAAMAQMKSEIRPQKSSNHMHFAKANDVALTFAMACNKMCRKWKAVSKDLTTKEREYLKHTNTRDDRHEPCGDISARAHMVSTLLSSSVNDISPHHKMCFTNFENALVHKIDAYLPRFKNTQHGWVKEDDTVTPLICRKLFNAFWNDGKGRPFGKNADGLTMNVKAKLPEHMPKYVENLNTLDAKCNETFTFDNAIEAHKKECHKPDCHDDCKWHECFEPCVAYASEVIHSFLAQKQGRTKAVAAGRRDPRSTMEALESDPIAWSQSIDDEYPKLVKMGVIDDNNGKGYTKRQLELEGIFLDDMKAVPLGLYHTHHYDKEGGVDRLKTRATVKGHSGNMTKGIHYSETFAATPREDTSRIMSAAAVKKNLKRKTGDVEKAFCWAGLPPGKQLALKLPPGLRRFDQESGEPTYGILRKNLYGTPPAPPAMHGRHSGIAEFLSASTLDCGNASNP